MAATFQQEKIHEVRDEIEPLLRAHFAEIAHYPDVELDPDWPAYEAIEQAGALRIFTVRDDGVLRGYAVFMVRKNIHYRQSLQAVQDILFLDKELRGRTVGYRFIRWCDEQLANESVQVVYHHVKLAHAHNFDPILTRLGYEPVDTIWGRRLDLKGDQ